MNLKYRWFLSTAAMALIAAGGTLFLGALTPTGHTAPVLRSPIYTTGSFTFSAPLELFANYGTFKAADSEPEIKIDLFGNIYITGIQGVAAGTDLWKSIDKGGSFVYMGQPDGAQDHCQSLPQCVSGGGGDDSIALSNGGYLYVSSLWLGSVTTSASYDGGTGGVQAGQAWAVNPAAATIPGDDRQWLASYGPQTVYMSYTDIGTGVVDFEKSTDGGKTFGAPVQTYPATSTVLSDVQGNMVVDQYNGNIYITFVPLGAGNQVYIERSTDGGSTWTLIQAYNGPAGTSNAQVFPTTAVDRGGNLHIAFSNCGAGHTNCQIYLVSSPAEGPNGVNTGNTWLSAVQVSSGAATATAVEPTIAAGSPGVVDMTWLGSPASTPDVASNWHVFFSQTQNALAANPVFAQNQAETNIMHKWDICFNGTGCANNAHQSPGNRDLFEYYSMAIDDDGNANIVYTDSVTNCPDATCITNQWFTKQTGGPSAYSPPRAPSAATFAANLNAFTGSGSDGEPNSWVDSHNCIFGGAIDGSDSDVFRSQNAGTSFTSQAVVLGTGMHGGDFDIITFPQVGGARPDFIYTADLGVSSVHIGKSTNGGNTYFQPGTGGSAGEVSASSDRMWLASDHIGADQFVYLMDHEFVSEDVRFSATANDMPWVTTSGITEPELVATNNANTNPGPVFVDKAGSHTIYGVFNASTNQQNSQNPPFGTLLNVWDAVGPPPAMAGALPGPFVNHPIFKGLLPSPTTPAPPAGSTTFGTNVASIFPAGDSDSAGNVYVAWAMNSTRTNEFSIWFASSHDHGQTFYGPWRVSQGTGTCVFPWLAAGDNGRVDIVWYESSTVGDPNTVPGSAQWTVMFGQSLNANSREPVFAVATASDHIIHTGTICTTGLFGCPPVGTADRSLLDFFEVAIGPDGLANIFTADNDSTGGGTTHINYIRQNGGPLALTNPSAVTCLPVPVLTSVVSRMTHGSAGDFDVTMPLPPNSSPRGVECRSSTAGNYKLVFTFTANLTSVASATVSSGTGSVNSSAIGPNPNQYTVNLTGVTNQQYIIVKLNNVVDSTGATGNIVSPQLGILTGDVNANGVVSNTDVSLVKGQVTAPVGSTNFREDVNANGVISNTDVSVTKANVTNSLPSTP